MLLCSKPCGPPLGPSPSTVPACFNHLEGLAFNCGRRKTGHVARLLLGGYTRRWTTTEALALSLWCASPKKANGDIPVGLHRPSDLLIQEERSADRNTWVETSVCNEKKNVFVLLGLLFRQKALRDNLFPLQPEVIQNMTEFKRGLPLFPLVKPHINFMAAKL